MLLVVAADLVRGDGCHLLHRRPAHKQHGGLWEFPGGKLEIGETSRAALKRELCEELGIEVDASDFAPICFAESEGGGARPAILLLLYRCWSWRGEPMALEGGAVQWFTSAQMHTLPMPPLDECLTAAIHGIEAQ
jgi:8-oxo-dGTP diphosphatase